MLAVHAVGDDGNLESGSFVVIALGALSTQGSARHTGDRKGSAPNHFPALVFFSDLLQSIEEYVLRAFVHSATLTSVVAHPTFGAATIRDFVFDLQGHERRCWQNRFEQFLFSRRDVCQEVHLILCYYWSDYPRKRIRVSKHAKMKPTIG